MRERHSSGSALEKLINAPKWALLVCSGLLLVTAALVDRSMQDVSLGVIFVIPMLPAAIAMNRWQIISFAFVLAWLSSTSFRNLPTTDYVSRFALRLLANSTTGFLIVELMRNRRLILGHTSQLEEQVALREEAESHLRSLAESSPAAIVTVGEDASILSGNRALREMLGLGPGHKLEGLNIRDYLPVLADALRFAADSPAFRTAAQCQGRKVTGELFVAQIWFSTYQTPLGRRLAAIAVDISEEIREREEQNLRQLLANNRIVAGAVSHEIRNVCGAIGMVYSQLRTSPGWKDSEDFHALGNLVGALTQIASTELVAKAGNSKAQTDLSEVLSHFRIMIAPVWEEAGGDLAWDVPDHLPRVFGESFGILQALLNLHQNSLRATNNSPERHLRFALAVNHESVRIAVTDSGPGIPDTKNLFEPFRAGSEQSGLGLYVSRAILRSYGGDLRFEPVERGCRFVAELRIAKR
ncbi:MAG: PAS domain S-box protein [Bryobacterales bacterium]|nr:PAS domain S-box protein [Bryobacterales bacterium]